MPFPPRRLPAPRARRERLAALLVCAPLLAVLPCSGATAGGATEPAAGFDRFAAAWETRSTASIVGCMEEEGKVVFSLFAYPLSGKQKTMGPEQAKETLKTYFKKIASVSLKDVSPKISPKNVRLYEYGYKASGENARTTHLQVKLKQDKQRLWVLASVTESARPRPHK